jgi:hypothetical protein
MAAEAEKQIAQEPDVANVQVLAALDAISAGLVRFNIFIRTRTGLSSTFNFGFQQH